MLARKDDRSRSKKEESPEDADRTFPNRHRPNIIGGLNRKNNSRHWSLIAPIDIYLSTLWNFISKRWPIIFFYGIGNFVIRCRLQNLQCRPAFVFSCERNRSCVSADTGMFSFTRLEKHWPDSAKKQKRTLVVK